VAPDPGAGRVTVARGKGEALSKGNASAAALPFHPLAFDPIADRRCWIGSSLGFTSDREAPVVAENPSAAMTPAEQAAQKLETPFSVRHRQLGGRNLVQVSSNACAMEALRERIRSQSRAVAEHIAADGEAQAFLDDWATPEPLSP